MIKYDKNKTLTENYGGDDLSLIENDFLKSFLEKCKDAEYSNLDEANQAFEIIKNESDYHRKFSYLRTAYVYSNEVRDLVENDTDLLLEIAEWRAKAHDWPELTDYVKQNMKKEKEEVSK